MVVAGLRRDFLGDEPARSLEIKHRNHRLQQRHAHPLPLTRFLTLEQRRQNSVGAVQASGGIGDCDSSAHGSPAGLARNRHQSAHALRDLVEARTLGIGAVLPET